MSAFLIIAIFIAIAILSSRAATAQLRAFNGLSAKGHRGRALVLSSMRLATGVTMGGRRFQRRQMTIEIEVKGHAPYQLTNMFLVPRGVVEPVPGCSLEVAVDPRNRQNVAILGPGGFTGPWLRVGPPAPY